MIEGEDPGREDNLAEQLEAFKELVRQNEKLRTRNIYVQSLGRAAMYLVDSARGGVDWLFEKFTNPASYPMRVGGTYEKPIETDENFD